MTLLGVKEEKNIQKKLVCILLVIRWQWESQTLSSTTNTTTSRLVNLRNRGNQRRREWRGVMGHGACVENQGPEEKKVHTKGRVWGGGGGVGALNKSNH